MNLKSFRNICRISTTLLTLLCALSMFGCNKNAAIAGKYVDKKYAEDYTELKADGTFFIHQRNLNSSGKYSVESGRLILTLSSGEVFEGKIVGNTIVGNQGNIATKQ